jgi:RimJ/RimL family protein N-acetyltransferase
MPPHQAPERIETERLLLRKPVLEDDRAIFERYASDPEVTRFLAWPRHQSIEQTRAFLHFSDGEWARWPAGPYLIESRARGQLLGSTGLAFETLQVASTGYVLAQDAWGHGYATEGLLAIVDLATNLGVHRLYAVCHVDHEPSARVLEKGGLTREAMLPSHFEFPNLAPDELGDVFRYAITLTDAG